MSDATVSHSGHRLKPLAPAMLRELSVRSNLRGAVQSLGHYGMVVLVGALIWRVSSIWGVLWALPLMAVQGYLVAFLFMAVHETAHKTAFKSRGLNLVVGYLSGFVIGLPYEYYCLFHWDHHRYTQDPEKDPELVVGVKPKSDTQLALAYSGLLQVAGRLRLMLGHAVISKVVVPWIPENRRAIIVTEALAYVALYALLLVLSLWFSSALLLWVWIVPLIIGQFFLRPYL
jgi:fatty acid desaturase